MNYPGEIWKELDLSEYCPKNQHWVSNFGRAKKTYRNKGNEIFVYNPPVRRDKQKVIIVKMTDGTSKTLALHRMIAELFIPKKSEEEKYVLHNDYNKENNEVSNLRWATHEEYIKYSRTNPKWVEACKNNTFGAKLSEAKVKVIKRLLNNPERPTKVKVVAKQFGISVSQARRIKKGKRWGHIDANLPDSSE